MSARSSQGKSSWVPRAEGLQHHLVCEAGLGAPALAGYGQGRGSGQQPCFLCAPAHASSLSCQTALLRINIRSVLPVLPSPPSWLPTVHVMKLKSSCGLQGPRICSAYLPNFTFQLFLIYHPPSTLAPLFLQPSPTSGPLHLLCSLPETLKLPVLTWLPSLHSGLRERSFPVLISASSFLLAQSHLPGFAHLFSA